MSQKIVNAKDIQKISEEYQQNAKAQEDYELRNAAKFRAINMSRNYDEFRNIVDAAHLQPFKPKAKITSSDAPLDKN